MEHPVADYTKCRNSEKPHKSYITCMIWRLGGEPGIAAYDCRTETELPRDGNSLSEITLHVSQRRVGRKTR